MDTERALHVPYTFEHSLVGRATLGHAARAFCLTGATGGPKPQTGFRGKADMGFPPCLASLPTRRGLARGKGN